MGLEIGLPDTRRMPSAWGCGSFSFTEMLIEPAPFPLVVNVQGNSRVVSTRKVRAT
jgi:hypothetical protein